MIRRIFAVVFWVVWWSVALVALVDWLDPNLISNFLYPAPAIAHIVPYEGPQKTTPPPAVWPGVVLLPSCNAPIVV